MWATPPTGAPQRGRCGSKSPTAERDAVVTDQRIADTAFWSSFIKTIAGSLTRFRANASQTGVSDPGYKIQTGYSSM